MIETTGTSAVAERVRASIDADLAQVIADKRRIEDSIPAAVAYADEASEAEDAHLREHGLEEIHLIDDFPEPHRSKHRELHAAFVKANDRVCAMLDRATRMERRIQALGSEGEFTRRYHIELENTNRIGKLRERSTMAKETAKDQGVPEAYLNTETGNFRIGMDARLKSDLINAVLGIESENALHKFTAKDAEALLKKRGWTSFLDRKREIIKAREEKATARAAEKEAAAKERAAEKAAKAEASKAAKDAKKASPVATEEADHAAAMKAEKAARS